MARLSMSDLWDETRSFIRSNGGLLLPVGLATFGLGLVVLLQAVPPGLDYRQVVPAPWMLWMFPASLLHLLGWLVISALVLRPGISVREAFVVGFSRMPTAIVAFLGFLMLQSLLGLPAAVIAQFERAGPGEVGSIAAFANLAALAAVLWVVLRLLPFCSLLADRPLPALRAIRETMALTRGKAARLLGIWVLAAIAGMLVIAAVQFLLGVLLGLLSLGIGQRALLLTIAAIVTGATIAMVMTVWAVFVARLYARLAEISGSKSGT